ncbi:MAG TPA: BamA/TamA family outer membrane protein, partial [Blastocatellia bacterium]|nr:BamA/TamA family outer membrane protein [Blastocatellia bacterium]
ADPLDRELLPLTERFFSGGSTTLRGFDFEEAGPRDFRLVTQTVKQSGQDVTVTQAVSRPIGGNALVAVNAEIRRTIYRQISLVGFYDGGNVFRRISDINFKNFSHTIGTGVRFKTPLGPFRLDLGYLASDPFNGSGLTLQQQSQIRIPRFQIHLSFGQAF